MTAPFTLYYHMVHSSTAMHTYTHTYIHLTASFPGQPG